MRSNKRNKRQKSREQALRRLRGGTAAFNAWRDDEGRGYLELQGSRISDGSYPGLNLAGLKLRGSRIETVDLSAATIAGSNLNRSVLIDVNLTNAEMRQVRLCGARLDRVELSGANLYGSVRDDWVLRDVKCSHCWVSRDRSDHPDEPDTFHPGEFEEVYGGRRVKVSLPGGFQGIDLLALPFYAATVATRFPNQKIVFAGLSTLGDPVLEFRLESDTPADLPAQLTTTLRDDTAAIRSETERFAQTIIQQLIGQNDAQIRVIEALVARSAGMAIHATNVNVGTLAHGTYALASGGAVYNWGALAAPQDWQVLTAEIRRLAEQLNTIASTADERESAAQLAEAETAAGRGEPSKALDHLKAAGRWAFDTATKIGTTLAAEALKRAIWPQTPLA